MKANAMATLRRLMPPSQQHIIDETARLTGLSEEASVALSLCREALRDWCPDEERTKVMAFLLAVETRR